MGEILAFVAAVIGIAASIHVLTSDYGLGADIVAVVFLVIMVVIALVLAYVLIYEGNRNDNEPLTERSMNRVEPTPTKVLKSGEIVETEWSKLTKERTAHYHDLYGHDSH